MTKEELCIKAGLLNKNGSLIPGKIFDYALPQYWLDDINQIMGEECVTHFVWLYDSIGGRPFSLTKRGWNLLDKYNKRRGTYWPIEECNYVEGEQIEVIYGTTGNVVIKGENFEIKGSHLFIYHLANELDKNAISETKTESIINNIGRYIKFEIEKEVLKTVSFRKETK